MMEAITLPILDQSVKILQVIKLTDMFQISAWKFYYKLSNNLLPSYFKYMKPSLPVICNYYGIRNPKFYLPPIIKHAFAEQMIQYCLIKLLNNDIDASHIINCIHQHTFCKCKLGLKYGTIDKYSEECKILKCIMKGMDESIILLYVKMF